MKAVNDLTCPSCGTIMQIVGHLRVFAFSPKEETMTVAELRKRARENGADPDRVDYSQCTDYRPEDERLEQNGQGWAEPPDETSHSNTPPRPRIMNGFEMARWVVDTYVDGSKIREKVNARIAEAEAQYAERLNRILPVNLRTYSAPK